jgi:molybdate transport system substrate-binding protein
VKCAALAGVAGFLLAACSSSAGGGPSASPAAAKLSGRITVYAASSLTEAFTTLQQQFGRAHPSAKITFSFGASDELATQINNGAPVDVFASASPTTMAEVDSAEHPTDFATNKLEIATPPSNPAHVTSIMDLAKPGVKIAVCDPAVPCGDVAQTVFANAKLEVTPAARETDVKSVIAAVESGEVDAGMVYVTDVQAAGKILHGVAIPDSVNATTDYLIATLNQAANPTLARAWVSYVLSHAGAKVLTADGFGKP